MTQEFRLGQKLKDIVTEFEGIAVARVEFINGCVQYALRPKVNDKGEMIEPEYIDVDRLQFVDIGVSAYIKTPVSLVGSESPPTSTTFD